MGYIGLALCKHDNSDKPYLFRMPGEETLKEGDRVVVDTKNGEQFATVIVGDGYVDPEDRVAQMTLKLAGVEKYDDLKRVLKKVRFRELEYEEE